MKPAIQTALILLSSMLAAQCSSLTGSSKKGDYLNPEFSCLTGPASSELDESYIKKYQAYRAMAFHAKQPENVFAVLTGDSIAHLFLTEYLGKYIPGIPVLNRGIGGDTTELFLSRLERDVISLKPKVVIISIGGNDTLGGRCLSKTLSNTKRILDRLTEALPRTQVYMASIPPVNLRNPNSITPYYNRQLEYLTENYPAVHFMDLWPILAEKDSPYLKEEFQYRKGGKLDAVHFNEKGYEAWGQVLTEELKKYRK